MNEYSSEILFRKYQVKYFRGIFIKGWMNIPLKYFTWYFLNNILSGSDTLIFYWYSRCSGGVHILFFILVLIVNSSQRKSRL